MPRPRMCRRVRFKSNIDIFKPQGIPLNKIDIIELSYEELEALRLKNIQELDQNQCAEKMNTSQSTFQRILNSAYKKISMALIQEKALKIIK